MEVFNPNEARLYSVMTVTGSGHILEHRNYHLNTTEVFFTVRGVEHWEMVAQRVYGVFCCGDA